MSDEDGPAATLDLIALTADVVAAHVGANHVAVAELPSLIAATHCAFRDLTTLHGVEPLRREPAVPVRLSVKRSHIVCLEDGKKVTMLKRYIRTNFNLSPDEYRRRWDLPSDYPMVAPCHSEMRRALAQSTGLGRRSVPPNAPAPASVEGSSPTLDVERVQPTESMPNDPIGKAPRPVPAG